MDLQASTIKSFNSIPHSYMLNKTDFEETIYSFDALYELSKFSFSYLRIQNFQ